MRRGHVTAQLFCQHKDSSGMFSAISMPFGSQAWCGGREMASVLAEGQIGGSPMQRWLGDPKEQDPPKTLKWPLPNGFRAHPPVVNCCTISLPNSSIWPKCARPGAQGMKAPARQPLASVFHLTSRGSPTAPGPFTGRPSCLTSPRPRCRRFPRLQS